MNQQDFTGGFEKAHDQLSAWEGKLGKLNTAAHSVRPCETIRKQVDEPGRNELCPCCSGLKYKRCHWLLERMPAGEEREEFAKKITAAQKEWRRWHASKEPRTSP